MSTVDEILSRTGKEVMKRELLSLGFYFMLIILSMVPFFKYNNPWWLCLTIAVGPVIHLLNQRQERLTATVVAALPDEAKEELKRRKLLCEKLGKKYLLITVGVMIPLCFGIIFYGQHVLEKKEREGKEGLKLRMQQIQQRNAPGPR